MLSDFNVTRAEVRATPCSSCGVKNGACYGNGPIRDFEHEVRIGAAKEVKFKRWLAEHDRAVAEAAAKQALEDAADALYGDAAQGIVFRNWLRARAASISTDKAGEPSDT